MELRYRGTAYNLSTENLASLAAANSPTQAPLPLTYRGHRYTLEPQAKTALAVLSATATNVMLMYRGQTYQSQVTAVAYQTAHATTWQWQLGF
jgi:hypothetical protein